MYLVERLWAALATVVSIVSLSPLPDGGIDGPDLQFPLAEVSFVEPPRPIIATSAVSTQIESGPSFRPEGASKGFNCSYPTMTDWEYCGGTRDRQCWLRNLKNGSRYDLFTNYEEHMPKGIDRHYSLNLTDGKWAADGMMFDEAKLYNGEYPGPWIEACWGDRVFVEVTNSLSHNGTSVHWHGIRQMNSMHMDGVNGVTQCPIAPGDSFLYNWTATQYGTAWYHSHYSVQYADGAVGPLTLYGPASANYDEAIEPILMTDWGHKSAFVAAAVGKLDQKDILLNGRGNVTRFNNSRQPDEGIKIEDLYSINFQGYEKGKPLKKYLLRIINTSFDTTFVVSIDNHLMQIVSADFVPISPYTNTSILVGIGQRYNVIVEANPIVTEKTGPLDDNGNYWIRTEVAKCFFFQKGDDGYERSGIIRYNPQSKLNPTTSKWKNVSLDCSDETYADLHPILNWNVTDPIKNDRLGKNFLVGGSGVQPKPYPLAKLAVDFKSSSFVPMRVNYADPPFIHLDKKKDWDPAWRIIPENRNSTDWIYIVIESNGPHPMHLHGHDFAILEQAYNKPFSADTLDLKLLNPPRRDVVLLPRSGYVVIAFKADNPGAWLVHCHIADHISWGLGMTIMERQDSAFQIWPNNDSAVVEARRVCDNWTKWQKNTTHWAKNPDCKETDKELCFQDDSGV